MGTECVLRDGNTVISAADGQETLRDTSWGMAIEKVWVLMGLMYAEKLWTRGLFCLEKREEGAAGS